jgi:hypothetical protein
MKFGVEASDILNFDEKGFRASVTSGEVIIVPTKAKNVCIFIL